MPAWSEGHPLSEAANHFIGSMVRKVGGFTFQELNLTIDDIRATSRGRRRPVLRLRQPPRLPPRAGHRRHRVPPAHPAHLAGARGRPGLAGARPAEPRRADLRAGALGHRPRDDPSTPTTASEITGAELADSVRQDLLPAPHRARRPVQPGVHHQRDRLHHRHRDRRGARDHRPGPRSTTQRLRPDPAGAPAAGHVQRAAARRVRAVRLGPVRHDHAAAGRGQRAARRRATPAGSTAPRTT